MRRIVLLGPPASGKGTQGHLLAKTEGLAYFSTGKQLRREMKAGSDLGRRAKPFLDQGRYVPDELALILAFNWLKTVEGGWVLDGFPRTVPQAEDLDEFLNPKEAGLLALLLDVPVEELEGRVAERRECLACPWVGTRAESEESGLCPSCGGTLGIRSDDEIENFRERLRAFGDLTMPVADYYDSSGRLRSVSGCGTPEEVFARLKSQLD